MQGIIISFAFGAKNVQDVDTFVVDFNLMTKDDSSLQLHANVVHKITSPIQRGPLQSSDLEFLLSVSPEKMADTIQNQQMLTF